MPRNGRVEQGTQAPNKKGTGGNGTIGGQPQFRIEGEASVAGAEVSNKGSIRVCSAVGLLDDDFIPFEKLVALVTW
jgi:hypothetical protein